MRNQRPLFTINKYQRIALLILLLSVGTTAFLWKNVREMENEKRAEHYEMAKRVTAACEIFLADGHYTAFNSLLELLVQMPTLTSIECSLNGVRCFQAVQNQEQGETAGGDPDLYPIHERLQVKGSKTAEIRMLFSLREFKKIRNNIFFSTASIFALTVIVIWSLIRLVSLERNKEDLIYRIAHDAKQDLTVIQGQAATLLNKLKKQNASIELRRDVNVISESALSIDRYLNNLNDQQRLMRRRMDIAARPVPLAKVVESTAAGFREKCFNRNLRLELAGMQEVWVSGDEHVVKRILMNLVHNAIKYSPLGGRIAIRLEKREHAARVYVSDEGPGIARADWDKVFKPYGRLPHSKEGMGLGLANSRELIELMGGALAIGDSVPGQGTTFYAAFPLETKPKAFKE